MGLRRWLGTQPRTEPSHDVGLQAERTAMAWERTALGVGGVSAMMLHGTTSNLLTALPGMLGLGVALGLLVMAQLRYEHTVRRIGDGLTPAAAPLVLTLAVTVATLAVLSIGLILVEGSS